MRRSSIIMLIAAVALGLVAVLFARTFMGVGGGAGADSSRRLRTVPTVVAAADINFGEKLAPAKLKLVEWPADNVPAGSFQRIEDLTSADGRTAMRPIVANEILTEKSLATGANRLSTAPLLNPQMRAIAVPVNEVAGVSGLIFPGDRVDVFFTRQPEEAMPYAELLAQGVRVLAVGSDTNLGKEKPEVVKTATIEVTPLQAQKISLAQTVGTLNLVLRHFTDEARVRLETAQVMDLNDGTITRLVRKPGAGSGGGGGPAGAPATGGSTPAPPPPGVVVMRGTTESVQPVMGK
ncbi:Flp pilus assembly protein CpaB [Sandarakinorhabdus cyanobacteriorum]|uniref:Flp pilus assembly protein CpaB n=1 Tax=Sandarakinorhabdus cyanobacteriorum TaxID=1981098 RepID=A0A255Y8V8_9SPHN|nr:Flp pilus assembly protein CpaB [Sandarakinorhabdus cyanobacteriorum]OYQ25648.1 Flp pilus assembly protein CpaB [Sandarakinorhabdus cyanobacteriorum]